jgi:hypothetical protein
VREGRDKGEKLGERDDRESLVPFFLLFFFVAPFSFRASSLSLSLSPPLSLSLSSLRAGGKTVKM